MGNQVLKAEPLPLLSNPAPALDILLPNTHVKVPNDKNLTNLREDVLYIPTARNFESVDSFFLRKNADGESFTLVALQMTVAQEHSILASGLVNIVKGFERDPGGKVRAITDKKLVFVSPPPGNLQTVQIIVVKEPKPESKASRKDATKANESNPSLPELPVTTEPIQDEEMTLDPSSPESKASRKNAAKANISNRSLPEVPVEARNFVQYRHIQYLGTPPNVKARKHESLLTTNAPMES